MTRGCNLEAGGIRLRLRQGYLHTAVLVVVVVLLFVLDAPRSVRWIAGLPAFLAAIGYLQAATKT
jgi:hypothetical protein